MTWIYTTLPSTLRLVANVCMLLHEGQCVGSARIVSAWNVRQAPGLDIERALLGAALVAERHARTHLAHELAARRQLDHHGAIRLLNQLTRRQSRVLLHCSPLRRATDRTEQLSRGPRARHRGAPPFGRHGRGS